MNHEIFTEPRIKIPTPEQVYLDYPLAGVGRRALAALIDAMLLAVAQLIALVIWGFLMGTAMAASAVSPTVKAWALAALIAVLAIVLVAPIFYFAFFEYYWKGQTPGKKVANIQVMRASGLALDRTSAALRNIFRLVDWLPTSYFVGIWSVMLSRNQQRLGDLVAGTIVVALPKRLAAQEVQASTSSLAAPGGASFLYSGGRNEERRWLMDQYLRRRDEIEPESRARIARQLAEQAGIDPAKPLPALEQEFYQRLTS